MKSSAFADLPPADQYVAVRAAAGSHTNAESMAALPPSTLDQLVPGARAAYENRGQKAAALLARLGIDPQSAEYQAAAKGARDVLRQVDQLGPGNAA